jgi:RNA polymerase sigma-70 factor, ECF subfamily
MPSSAATFFAGRGYDRAVDAEAEIGRHLTAGEHAAAAARVIESYGAEVLGFLVSELGSHDDAGEAFQQACEDLWVGIARFERRSSVRTWFYVLARHAAARLRRSPHRRAERRVRISQVSDLATRVRTATPAYLRTDVKDGFAAIRDALSSDDRTLLVLRVDRNLSWNDIAAVMAGADDAGEAGRARPAARLRKRFQLVKAEIRSRARAAGLVLDD